MKREETTLNTETIKSENRYITLILIKRKLIYVNIKK